MTAGLSATNTAHAWLNTLRGGGNGATVTAPSALYAALYVGDPGATGTANASAVTTRQAVTFAAAASGIITLSNAPAFAMTGSETITHIGVFDAATSGNFRFSAPLSASRAVVNGDTLTLTALSVALSGIAA